MATTLWFLAFLCTCLVLVKGQQVQPIPVQQVVDFREVNWCVTGLDEPELHFEFPFNQFVPLLKRDRRYTQNPRYRYRIEFYEIFSRMPINTKAACNASEISEENPWCVKIDCGPDNIYCQVPPFRTEYLKYVGQLYKTIHVVVRAEVRRREAKGVNEIWEPQPLEGLILQASHNPKGVGIPTGQFFIEEDFICHDCNRTTWGVAIPCRKRSVIESVHPTVLAYHHLMNAFNESGSQIRAGTQSEVHTNFRWFSPPCGDTRRMEFTLLAVRSFKESKYDVVRLGPYEVVARGHSYHPEHIPTPIFLGYFYHRHLQGTWCHAATARDIQVTDPSLFRPFTFSPSLDNCTRNVVNPRRIEIGDTETESYPYICYNPDQPKCVMSMFDTSEYAYSIEQSLKPCADVCPVPFVPPTTTTTERPPPLIKRNYHGGVLIMTNFCLLPINTFIARFYKETLNVENYKGVKVWFWWHLLGTMGSCILIYFGTFQGGPDMKEDPHTYLGNSYVLVLAICYFTAWGRHLTKWINLTTEFIHGCLGYIVIVLAHVTMHYAPGVGPIPKFLVDFQIFCHCLFIIVMSGHVCLLDHKFGMRPRRRHFPTVQACFDDIPIPQNKFRMVMLFILTAITFSCSILALFFQ